MNPFDLSGPPFLAFYAGVAAFVAVAVKLLIDAGEGGAPPALPLGDPYQIAWLRGGTPEAARIAVLALTDRRLLTVSGDNLVNFAPRQSFVREPIERAILSRCAQSGTPATAVLSDPGVEQACAPYKARLEQMQLVPDAGMRARRYRWFAFAADSSLASPRSRSTSPSAGAGTMWSSSSSLQLSESLPCGPLCAAVARASAIGW
jgi:uncharacterized protein (TIGR04222 family)